MMLDDLIETLTSGWRFRAPLLVMLSWNMMIVAFRNLDAVFLQAEVPHHCKVPGVYTVEEFIPLNGDSGSSCEVYRNPLNHSEGTRSCREYVYQPLGNEVNVVTEWDLVCNWQHVSSLITSLYFIGLVIGSIIFGDLADRYGRRPVLLICVYIQSAVSLATYFQYSLTVYVILRILMGVFVEGLFCTGLVILMEYSPTDSRSFVGGIYYLFYSAGCITLGVMAYYLRNWRDLQLAMTLPFILSCFYLLTVPESLKWLLSMNNVEKAKSTAKKCAKWNGVDLPKNVDEQLEDLAKELSNMSNDTNSYSYLDLVKTPKLRRITFILPFIETLNGAAYYGVLFNMTSLTGDKYVNFLISVTLEFLASIIAVPVLEACSRKKLFVCIMLFAGTSCISGIALEYYFTEGIISIISSWLILMSMSIGVLANTVLRTLLPELYPTVLRNKGLSYSIFFARTGSFLAPYLVTLGYHSSRVVPFIVSGLFYYTSGFLSSFLPENKDKGLADTIQEIEEMTNIQKNKEPSFNFQQMEKREFKEFLRNVCNQMMELNFKKEEKSPN